MFKNSEYDTTKPVNIAREKCGDKKIVVFFLSPDSEHFQLWMFTRQTHKCEKAYTMHTSYVINAIFVVISSPDIAHINHLV